MPRGTRFAYELGAENGPSHHSVEEGSHAGPVQVQQARPYLIEAGELLRRADAEGQVGWQPDIAARPGDQGIPRPREIAQIAPPASPRTHAAMGQ